jgi:3-carboxy-cis,cis-muconate cycloisomerase
MARPSSSGSDASLFGSTYARGEAAAAVSDSAWLRAMLDAEAALALAQSDVGLLDGAIAEQIARACEAPPFGVAEVGARAGDGGNPVIPLVSLLRDAVGGPAAERVHWGATSQDILDTASMLVVRRALDPITSDLHAAAEATAGLARTHRTTPMTGRTLMQAALPITFGWEACGWLAALDAGVDALGALRDSDALAVQLGGPVGILADFGDAGPGVVEAFARRLGLAAPTITWHTERSRNERVAAALGIAAGACAKVGRDVILLSQTEVGEVREEIEGAGGSSSMAHKRNPVAAISAVACAEQVPPLISTLFAAAEQEHQRAAGRWHAEWLSPLVSLTGSAAAWVRESLEHLVIDPQRLTKNLETSGVGSDDRDRYLAAAAASVDRALATRAL